MSKWIIVVLLILGGCILTGCAFIEPTTELSGGPFGWRFYDSKDNDITLKNAEFNADSRAFSIDELTIVNRSSPVIEANVQQMLAFVEQQKAANEGIKAAFDGLAQMTGLITRMAETILPGSGVSVESEWGGGEGHLGPSNPCPPVPATRPDG